MEMLHNILKYLQLGYTC